MTATVRPILTACLLGALLLSPVPVATAASTQDTEQGARAPSPQAAYSRLQQIHELQTGYQGRAATAEEKAALQHLVDELHEAGVATLMDNILDARDDHHKGINLPVYPDSTLLMHAPAGIDMTVQGQLVYSLPLASFLTTDSPETVRDYYLEQLKGYDLISGEQPGDYQILAGLDEPDQALDAATSFITPNVRIRPTDSRLSTHLDGARALIHLYYPIPTP